MMGLKLSHRITSSFAAIVLLSLVPSVWGLHVLFTIVRASERNVADMQEVVRLERMLKVCDAVKVYVEDCLRVPNEESIAALKKSFEVLAREPEGAASYQLGSGIVKASAHMYMIRVSVDALTNAVMNGDVELAKRSAITTKDILVGLHEYYSSSISHFVNHIEERVVATQGSVRACFNGIGIFSAAIFGIAIFFAVSLGRFIFAHISRLHSFACEISKGHFDVATGVPAYNDEIGRLAAVLEVMRDSIRNSEHAMATYNENLSRNVLERTAELSRMNRELAEANELYKKEVSQHVEVEKALFLARYCIEISGDKIIWVRRNGSIAYANNAVCKKLGYEAHEFEIMRISLLFKDLSDDRWDAFWEMIKEKKRSLYESVITRKNGETFPVEVGANYFVEGTVEFVFMFVRDLTDRKREEEKKLLLERDLNMARKLESIGTLAAGIAHEINTPVQFIGDNVQFLQAAFQDCFFAVETYRKFVDSVRSQTSIEQNLQSVDKIEKAIDFSFFSQEVPTAIKQTNEGIARVSKIVGAMRDFSHIGGEEHVYADLNKAIDTTVTISRNVWKYVSDVDLKFDPDLPQVKCNVADINQVIMNLIVNAAHAIEDVVKLSGSSRHGMITITTTHTQASVCIAVADTGTGIPEHVRERIFDPFFTTKSVGKGTGQGLGISRMTIVEKHKGTLTFTTEMGKGTTFYVTLPIHGA